MKNSAKQRLEIIRELQNYDKGLLSVEQQIKLALKIAGVLHEKSVPYQMIGVYKERIYEMFLPNERVQASSVFQEVLKSYNKWLGDREFNEYFIDSWNTLLSYTFSEEFPMQDTKTHVVAMLYYEYENLLNHHDSSQYTMEEQIFLGCFRTVFPCGSISIAMIEPAIRFFSDFKTYHLTMNPLDIDDLSAMEMVETVRFWKKHLNRKQNMKLERVK